MKSSMWSIVIAGIISQQAFAEVIDLSGKWQVKLSMSNTNDSVPLQVTLPGSLPGQGIGERPSLETQWTGGRQSAKGWSTDERYAKYATKENFKFPFWLNPETYYVGPAWYEREIDIPADWKDKSIELMLERPHWGTTLVIDGREIGKHLGLGVPHRYDLTGILTPGKHKLALCVDNRMLVPIGESSHSISDHTQGNWNGIVGRMELVAQSRIHIDNLQIWPDAANRKAKVTFDVLNQSDRSNRTEYKIAVRGPESFAGTITASGEVEAVAGKSTRVSAELNLGKDFPLWDEFTPNVSTVTVDIGTDKESATFGLRDFKVEGTQFTINGRKTFMRGTLECCIFPKTGHPPMDKKEWTRIYRVCKNYGLNHVRFHSWCPPKVAFDAADEEGVYLQVESCSAWSPNLGTPEFDVWAYAETDRVLREYGNHPSFVMMMYGNEPGGKPMVFLSAFCTHYKAKDPRRLYSSGANWPLLKETEYHNPGKPRIQRWGEGLKSIINAQAPRTDFDFAWWMKEYSDKPTISHEIGQWCVYPNFKEIEKYTGYLKAKNFEVFRDLLVKNNMGDMADEFLYSSGRLQTLCYKADIEAALRTQGFGGFQLLDLHDFPGQGTALVGVLDVFWDEKGYVTGKEYSRFCSSVVPLARLSKMVYTSDETIHADIEVANFGRGAIRACTPEWRLKSSSGKRVAEGTLAKQDIALGLVKVGSIQIPLSRLLRAEKLKLEVSVGDSANDWDLFVYPKELQTPQARTCVIAEALDAATITALESGKTVVLTIPPEKVKVHPKYGKVPAGFSSIFWNTAWTARQAPHTLGIHCDPQHPVFKDFPTDCHNNWQWWELVTQAQPFVLNEMPAELRPLVWCIDDWFSARRLAYVFEAKVGKGKLLACSIDLKTGMDKRPAARQLLKSLLDYAESNAMNPKTELNSEQVQLLLAN
jgi:Glycosyl hydrolases family 2, sugar binding domain/Glycosyl hydrolases family 2